MKEVVLITGGLGYVGGRIARAFSTDEQLHLRLSTRQENLTIPSWMSQGEMVRLDLKSDEQLDQACKDVKCVIHLAALNEIDSATNPEEALLVNTLGTLKILRAAERVGVEKFIYLSTAHVYGSPLTGVITEKTLPKPVHPYSITHKAAEDFVLAAHTKKSLIGLVIRLSNGFGAPINAAVNRWTLIVNDLCRQAVTTGKLVLNSSGLQKRDFITLLDVSSAMYHLMALSRKECDDGLFNLGGECSLQIIELVEIIASRCTKVLGFTPEIVRKSTSDEIPSSLDYRIDKLKATGFKLSSEMDNEIDATLNLCLKIHGDFTK